MSTVLITGASRGIGRSAAKRFAESGWDLLLLARNEVDLYNLSVELKSTGSKVFFKSIDLGKASAIEKGVNDLLDQGLTPSVLINNAGIAWTGPLLSMSLSSWQSLIQINLTSVFQMCSLVVPKMRKNGGLVINVSSHASRNIFPEWGAYCTVKAALSSFTKCLAEEERVNSIRACTLTLGSVNSNLWDTETVQADFDRDAMLTVDEVAEALLHLAQQPSNQLIEDITLMPAVGKF